MPEGWNTDDRRAIRTVGLWGGIFVTGLIVKGIMAEPGNVGVSLILGVLWLAWLGWAIVRTIRKSGAVQR